MGLQIQMISLECTIKEKIYQTIQGIIALPEKEYILACQIVDVSSPLQEYKLRKYCNSF